MLRCSEWLALGVSRYTGIDDNRDIQSNNYQYRVNLVCDYTGIGDNHNI